MIGHSQTPPYVVILLLFFLFFLFIQNVMNGDKCYMEQGRVRLTKDHSTATATSGFKDE